MPNVNEFLPFATGPGANVVSQATFAADSLTPLGFQAGIADSAKLNKVWRQASFVSAAIAQLISDLTSTDVLDDGDLTTFKRKLGSALEMANYGVDAGTINVYQVAFPVAPAIIKDGTKLRFKASISNTGASTFSPNGATAVAIYSSALLPLAGGEIIANSMCEVTWNSSIGFTGAWVLSSRQGAGRSAFVKQTGITLGANQTATNTLTFTTPSAGYLMALGAMNTSGLSQSVGNEIRINGIQYGADIVFHSCTVIGAIFCTANQAMTVTQNVISASPAPSGTLSLETTYVFVPA